MARIWVGDSRTVVLQRAGIASDEDKFIAKVGMSYSWFKETACPELLKLVSETPACEIIITMGVNDCASYTLGGALNADKYVDTVNELIKRYSQATIYYCSVNPVDGDYPSAYHPKGKIPEADFNAAIVKFNNIIKSSCKASYIDCYTYLKTSGFSTSDKLHYTTATTKSIYEYVLTCLTGGRPVGFTPRTVPPNYDDPWWINIEHLLEGGENGLSPYPAQEVQEAQPDEQIEGEPIATGLVLPSSAGYAWGRFYELLGLTPQLSTGNAEEWWDFNDGYERGNEPKLGAIMCWSQGIDENETDGKGHVAIVEQINEDGSLDISESLDSTSGSFGINFRISTITNENNNWGKEIDYTFRGFIYCPAVGQGGLYEDTISKLQVTSTPGGLSEEQKALNARYICKYLTNCGWTLNAIAGLLGNLEHESYINPGVTEIGGSGYGLVQWTPPSKFTNWCDKQIPPLKHDDVDSQLARIEYERKNEVQYRYSTVDDYGIPYTNVYGPVLFNDFATSTKSPYDLACAFVYNYERPSGIIWGSSGQNGKSKGRMLTQAERDAHREYVRKIRGNNASKWYKFLLNYCSGIGNGLYVSNFIINSIKATSINASFVTKNASKGTYLLYQNDNIKAEAELDIPEGAEFITFTVDNLVPNTQYSLSIKITGNAEDLFESDIVSFTTLQDFPDPIEGITLTFDDLALPDRPFSVNVKAPERWGYWREKTSNSYGYTVQLIVNGSCLKEIQTDTFSKKTFTPQQLKNFFGSITQISIGDNIQIGIRTWVTDNHNKKIFSDDFAVTSNSVCLLERPVTAYLNIK